MVRSKASIDRIENNYAVLILDNKDTSQVTIPVIMLPLHIKEGDIVSINISMDKVSTETAKRRVGNLLKELIQNSS